MSEFFKAAARCDITVVRQSPMPLDEKELVEEELRRRQWDTLSEKIEAEKRIREEIKASQLDLERQREQELRMRKLRLDEKRNEAIQHREIERKAKDEMQQRRNEELELLRIAAVEEQRMAMEADRKQAQRKVNERAYAAVQQKILSKEVPSLDDPQDIPSGDNLTYMDRLRIERERLGRLGQYYDGNSIKKLYAGEAAPQGLAPKSALERNLMEQQELTRKRLQEDKEQLISEEDEDLAHEVQKQQAETDAKIKEHQLWLTRRQEEESEAQLAYTREMEGIMEQSQKQHPIDQIHKAVREQFLKDMEAENLLEENLGDGFSYLDRLDHIMDAEKTAWREQLQYQKELQAGLL